MYTHSANIQITQYASRLKFTFNLRFKSLNNVYIYEGKERMNEFNEINIK